METTGSEVETALVMLNGRPALQTSGAVGGRAFRQTHVITGSGAHDCKELGCEFATGPRA